MFPADGTTQMRLDGSESTACTALLTRSCTTLLEAPLQTTTTPLISGETICCTNARSPLLSERITHFAGTAAVIRQDQFPHPAHSVSPPFRQHSPAHGMFPRLHLLQNAGKLLLHPAAVLLCFCFGIFRRNTVLRRFGFPVPLRQQSRQQDQPVRQCPTAPEYGFHARCAAVHESSST